MPTLLEQIEADAAARLVLPPDRQPAQELPRYKEFLKTESHNLKLLHREGLGGREICRARSTVLDALLRHIFEAVVRTAAPGFAPPLALLAYGGYGRGELNPFSDIDILILHAGDTIQTTRGKPHPVLAALTGPGGLLYTLYDVGLKVGHAVRNVDDCVTAANSDMQSKTSLIESRLIIGDKTLFDRMQAVLVAKCVRGYEEVYIKARVEDQATRRAKFGNSATMQEPNIKNGCGGLRDYQNLLWMAYFKYRTRTLPELQAKEMITEAEAGQLDAAYDYLLRVRNDLHYHVNRAVDVLTKSVQPAIAHNLGFTDRSPSQRLEKFMRELYLHTRNIDLITRTVEQRLALLPKPKPLFSFRQFMPGRKKVAEQSVDGFRIVEGELVAASPRVFRDQPRRLMRVFLHAQQRGLRFHPDLAHMVRNHLSLVDAEFLHDPHVHQTFLEILNQRGDVARILRLMHEVDFLGKYVPEFGKLTCLVQHEFYHQYTADEHTLVCLEKLDLIWSKPPKPLSHYSEIFVNLERPYLLYLTLLLHDAGKSEEGDRHEQASAQLAQRVAKRLGLEPADTASLLLLVEHHLLMSQLSQRRDLDDPAVIRQFSAQVKSLENLTMLTLHTVADTLGTSDKLWNGFKDTLIWTLYLKAREELAGGTEYIRAEGKFREHLAKEVGRLLPKTIDGEEREAHFAGLPPRYYQTHTPRQIGEDLTLAHRFMHLQIMEEDRALEPVVTWHNEPDRGYTAVTICTWDRAGLFSKIAGSFTAAGLNILGAQIFSRQDGIILDKFFVTDAKTGLLVDRAERQKFEDLLGRALVGDLDFDSLIAKQKLLRPLYQSLEGERIPTVVRFDNETSEKRTVVEIETEDRVGLLYTISRALSDSGLDISLAKISTEKGAAIDIFYVGEVGGAKVYSPERQHSIEGLLLAAIAKLDAP